LYKTIFTTKFVKTTYKVYNFVNNNYSQKITYLSVKILRKNKKKNYFLLNFCNKFVSKILCKSYLIERIDMSLSIFDKSISEGSNLINLFLLQNLLDLAIFFWYI